MYVTRHDHHRQHGPILPCISNLCRAEKTRTTVLFCLFLKARSLNRCRTFASTSIRVTVWKPGIRAWQNWADCHVSCFYPEPFSDPS